MKISYKQLQTYFEDALPAVDRLAEAITFGAFEIESIEEAAGDSILDIKVLPDRACYAKSYEGIAREVSTILGLTKKAGKVKIPASTRTVKVSVEQINEVLGSSISKDEVVSILGRLDIGVKESKGVLELAVPGDRQDLQTWRDIPEEVGRIYGYDKIPSELPKNKTFKPKVQKTFYYAEKIKNILVGKGFSEVYTYSLVAEGDFEIEKPLASDKGFLRTNLTDGLIKALELNAKHAELLGLDAIQIFEIGKVFTKGGEHTALCIGIKNIKKKQEKEKEKIKAVRDVLFQALGAEVAILCTVDDTGGIISLKGTQIGMTNNTEGVMALNLDMLVEALPDPVSYDDLHFGKAAAIKYKKFSLYPFMVRDIAVFMPDSEGSHVSLNSIIMKGIEMAGATDLLAKNTLFDTFKKDGKVSFAHRLIFQAQNRTLTDDEVNKIMESVYAEVKKVDGWEVR